jgi:hypothetical protein
VAPTVIHRPPAVTKNLVAGVEFASSDIRYRDRPIQGYQVIFDGSEAQPFFESKMEEVVEEKEEKKGNEEQKILEFLHQKNSLSSHYPAPGPAGPAHPNRWFCRCQAGYHLGTGLCTSICVRIYVKVFFIYSLF